VVDSRLKGIEFEGKFRLMDNPSLRVVVSTAGGIVVVAGRIVVVVAGRFVAVGGRFAVVNNLVVEDIVVEVDREVGPGRMADLDSLWRQALGLKG